VARRIGSFHSGHGEFRVQGETGILDSAPTLVLHDIWEHPYQPPSEIVAAVLYHRAFQLRERSSSRTDWIAVVKAITSHPPG
jgi:hypothetical protein